MLARSRDFRLQLYIERMELAQFVFFFTLISFDRIETQLAQQIKKSHPTDKHFEI